MRFSVSRRSTAWISRVPLTSPPPSAPPSSRRQTWSGARVRQMKTTPQPRESRRTSSTLSRPSRMRTSRNQRRLATRSWLRNFASSFATLSSSTTRVLSTETYTMGMCRGWATTSFCTTGGAPTTASRACERHSRRGISIKHTSKSCSTSAQSFLKGSPMTIPSVGT